ncbi:MAG: SCO family protein, partial [Burkholderiales bacterium]
MNKRAALRGIGLLSVAVLSSGILVACSEDKPQFNAIDLTGADYAKDFALADPQGRTRTLADFRGKVVAMFFGYTHCPDFCPTTMAELAQVKQSLGAEGKRLQAIFVTVDPERDTAENLKSYVTAFDPEFVALRPENEQQLSALAKDFKVYYKKVEGKSPGSYTM